MIIKAAKKNERQVNRQFKKGNVGIVEETRLGS